MQNKLQQAIEELQAQLAGREASMADLMQMVRLQLRAQHWQDAVLWAEQTLQLDAPTPECHRLLSEALLGLGMPQESARRLREAIELFPKNPALQAQMAQVQLELGDVDAAWAAMQLPLERQLDVPWVHRVHAMILERLGRGSEACELMDRAIAGNPRATHWLEQRAAMQARLDEASHPAEAVGLEADTVAAERDSPLPPDESPVAASLNLPGEALVQDAEPMTLQVSAASATLPEPPAESCEPLIPEPEAAALDMEPAPDAAPASEAGTELEPAASADELPASVSLPPPQRPAQALPSAKMIMVPRRDPYPRRKGGWLSRLWQRLLG